MWLRRHGDEGFAMIAVMIIGAVMFVLAGVIATRAQTDQRQVLTDRQWERALDVAEGGIEYTLHRLSQNKDYVQPAGFTPCTGTQAEMRACILEAAASAPTSDDVGFPVPQGQWVALKPQSASGAEGEIYAVGYIPDRANAQEIRVLRVEYDFKTGFTTESALLTNGDLQITGSMELTGTAPNAHANRNVYHDNSNDPFCTDDNDPSTCNDGTLTASEQCLGDHPDPCTEVTTSRTVPAVNPRDHYSQSQYDLCPDGTVRAGPNHPDTSIGNTGEPCEGQVLATAVGGRVEGSRGWFLDTGDECPSDGTNKGAIWCRQHPAQEHGVYYVYQGSAVLDGQAGDPGDPWLVSVVAEALVAPATGTACPTDHVHDHWGGDIDARGQIFVRYHDELAPLLFVAGRDFKLTGKLGDDPQFDGAMLAHEQFLLEGNPNINGTLIAEDACDTPDSMVTGPSRVAGSATINYDGSLTLPIGQTIRTTHWLEL